MFFLLLLVFISYLQTANGHGALRHLRDAPDEEAAHGHGEDVVVRLDHEHLSQERSPH